MRTRKKCTKMRAARVARLSDSVKRENVFRLTSRPVMVSSREPLATITATATVTANVIDNATN